MVNEITEPIRETPAAAENAPLPEADLIALIQKTVQQELHKEKESSAPADPEKLLQERENALKERENALRCREMRSFAREQLQKRFLPEALLDALCCSDEESCLKSLDNVEKAFRAAVQEGVVERMRGEEPLRSENLPLDTMDDNAYYHFTYVK